MALISTGSAPKLLWPGIKEVFDQTTKNYSAEWPALFETKTSDKAYEEYVQYVSFGLGSVKPEASSLTYDAEEQGFIARIVNSTIALGYIVTMEEQADNQYSSVSGGRARRLARALDQTKENIAANVYNRVTTAGFTGGDGVVLGSASHPTLYAGTQSNILSPAADLSETSLEDMIIQLGNTLDDRGLKMQLRVKRLILPNELEFEAERILKSTLRVSVADNDINAIKNLGSIPEYVVNHYLSDTDAFFLLTDAEEGMIHQERMARQFDMDTEFNTKNLLHSSVERYAFGWADWRGILASTGG